MSHRARQDRQSYFNLRLFGGFSLSYGQKPVHFSEGCQRLVAFLALCSRARRAHVAGNLWPEVSDTRAHGSLRTAVWQVHRFCPGLVITRGQELRFNEDVDIDTIRLEDYIERLLQEPHSIPFAELIDETIRKRLLPGWYDEWVLPEQERFKQLQLHAMEAAGEELLTRKKPAAALSVALNAVNFEPLRESAHRLVIRIHIAEGNICEALAHYRRYVSMLHRELGVQPTKQLQGIIVGLSRTVARCQ